MIDLDIFKFIFVGVGLVVLFLSVDFIWYLLRLTWAWVDDDDIKGKSIGVFLWVRSGSTYCPCSDGLAPWFLISFLLFMISIAAYLLISFYFVTLIILVLAVVAVVARWVRRLTKRFNLHELDADAHSKTAKGEIK